MNHEVIFGRTRYEYGTYADFWRLVELSGFRWSYLDDIDWQKRQTVIATPKNGEWQAIPRKRRAKLIWYMTERCRADYGPDDMSNEANLYAADEIWMADAAMARKYGAQYVMMGGCENFGHIRCDHSQYDIITLMYWSGRRQVLQHSLKRFSNGDAEHGTWGQAREDRINASRLMVSAHQDDAPWIEPFRFMLAGVYGKPILTESLADGGHWVQGIHYFSCSLEEMGDYAAFLLRPEHEVLLARAGANAWSLVCREHRFRSNIEEALR